MRNLWVLLTVLFVGCSTIKEVPINNITKIEYRDTTVFVRDTVTVTIPKEIIKEVVPQDTISILKTSVALSEAKIEKGMLHHKLEQKGTIKAQIDTFVMVEYIDRYLEREIPVKVEVEKKVIPNWCWYSLIFNIVIILLLAFRIYLKFRRVV